MMHPSIHMSLTVAVSGLLVFSALVAIAATGYLALLAIAAKRIVPPIAGTNNRFAIVVPAHNEERHIAATVSSLRAMVYPPAQVEIFVVADNCTDRTAEIAGAAGATVLCRDDTTRRGKGYALAFAFAAILDARWATAVAVVDADSVVSPNFLGAVDARLTTGATVTQIEYGVRNAEDSWRTRLMSLAFTLHHTLRSLGRERLGLSCGLRGNGMVFTTGVLAHHPHRSTALAEDVEYGLELGVAGIRVAYVPEATVLGEMPTTAEASRTQRDRWERGRRVLRRQWTPALLRSGLGPAGRVPLDLAADLLIPPLVTLAAVVTLGCAVAVLAWTLGYASIVAVAAWSIPVMLLAVYVGRGCALSPAGWRVLFSLAWVPAYAIWKLTLAFRRPRKDEWIRTQRSEQPEPDHTHKA